MNDSQLIALDFEYNKELERYEYKDITVEDFEPIEMVIKLNSFQVFGINDHRDLEKFIKLVYGE